jgi:hypothetical protein
MGFKDRPSADSNAVRPLPERPRPSLRLGGATSECVPPLSFHPTPTVYSAQHRAGLLHPATGHGVRHVSAAVYPRCSKAARCDCDLPNGAHPSKLFPPWQPVRVTTACTLSLFVLAFPCLPRALPLALGPVWRVRQPQGFEPPENPLPRLGVAAESQLDAPLGLVPFREGRASVGPVPGLPVRSHAPRGMSRTPVASGSNPLEEGLVHRSDSKNRDPERVGHVKEHSEEWCR